MRLERVAGVLSIVAAFIHGAFAPSHFEEWWGYGFFFLGAALAQGVYGLALLTDGFGKRSRPEDVASVRARFYVAGIVGNLAIVALYVVTRTVGIPVFGPAAGEVEEVGAGGVLSKAAELALVAVLVTLVRRGRPDGAATAAAR